MRTPICDFVEDYQNRKCSRLHMPGHKGHVFLGCEPKDITEVQGADVLHAAEGIIRESQQNAAMLFNTGHTFYSTEGSSLCIKVMIDALLQRAKRTGRWQRTMRPTILAARNVHRAMIDACALLDVDIIFLRGEVCSFSFGSSGNRKAKSVFGRGISVEGKTRIDSCCGAGWVWAVHKEWHALNTSNNRADSIL